MADDTALTTPDGEPLKGQSLTSYLKFSIRLEELGATLLELHWLGAAAPHRVRCTNDHDCSPKPGKVNIGQGVCRICVGKDPVTAEARFRAQITELGGTVIGKYKGVHVPILVRCAGGHDCKPHPSSVNSGRGICRICAGQDSATAEAAFRARVDELGGQVVGEYRGAWTPIAVRCIEGHVTMVRPGNVNNGQGVCRLCAGRIWDVFYVVIGLDGVKIGVTSGDPRPRLGNHERDGFDRVVRLHMGLPGDAAPGLERMILAALRDAREEPVRGREYFPARVLPIVLDLVDNHPAIREAL